MKLKKRFPALILSLALTVGLFIFPTGAASEVSTFPDITDPDVGVAVEVLRGMGILGGTGGGLYEPGNSLTRAEFSKIAILVMGKGEEAAAHTRQTIFIDVPSSHWARGYINLAVNTEIGGARLLQGMGGGCFEPGRAITYDEAVTVVLRMLGYGEQIAVNWPFSARSLALSLKLDAKLGDYTANGPITRGQAAILFLNALTAAGASGSVLDLGTPTAGVILTSVSAAASDGSPAASLLYADGTVAAVKPAVNMPASFLVGRRGTAYLDGAGRIKAFLPDEQDLRRDIVVQSANALGITGIDGTRLSVSSSTRVLRDGKPDIFGSIYGGLNRPGLMLTVYFTASGAIDLIIVRGAGSVSGEAAVAEADGVGAFDAITNISRTCRVIKNGAEMSLAELRKYDVGVFDASTDTLYVTDFRITALYQDASPNPYAPTSVTLFDREFDVLPSAVPDFENVKLGEMALFLFSPDGKIAGVRRQYDAPSTAIGVVRPGSTADAVTVDLLNAPLEAGEDGSVTLTAAISGSVSRYLGQLVSLSGNYRRGEDGKSVPLLSLTLLPSSGSAGELDTAARTVGPLALADNAAVYEKVGKSALVRISLTDIPFETVPASRVTFVHKDVAGKADILVLNDVTGDRYTYGFWKEDQKQTDDFGGEPVNNTRTTVTYGDGLTLEVIGDSGYDTALGGIVQSLETIGVYGDHLCAGFVTLTAAEGVAQANFDLAAGTFTYGSFTIPIAGAVCCYNETTGTWFDSLSQALLYSNSFTVYYDRTPETGAKVRVVVVH